MLQLSIQAVPSQKISAVLSNQNCEMFIYQKPQCMYFDLISNGVNVAVGVQIRESVPMNPIMYTGFQGNFLMIDLQGSDDPSYDGLGTRWVLVYLTADEYALI